MNLFENDFSFAEGMAESPRKPGILLAGRLINDNKTAQVVFSGNLKILTEFQVYFDNKAPGIPLGERQKSKPIYRDKSEVEFGVSIASGHAGKAVE